MTTKDAWNVKNIKPPRVDLDVVGLAIAVSVIGFAFSQFVPADPTLLWLAGVVSNNAINIAALLFGFYIWHWIRDLASDERPLFINAVFIFVYFLLLMIFLGTLCMLGLASVLLVGRSASFVIALIGTFVTLALLLFVLFVQQLWVWFKPPHKAKQQVSTRRAVGKR